LLCGAVLVGVVALNGVVDAKAGPARGSVCVRVGAKATDGVSGRGLVCVQTKVRGLRWRFAPTAVTTTTIAPSTSATTTVAAVNVAPRVVSASAATGNAVITIADMSPDTGVYAVQWVPVGQDFNSFSMYRTTTKTMTVPYLSCTRTYTLRVFVMQAGWQMTDGFVNQNVTPHSATFDLTMPACTATAATVAALTCAQGGTCAIGDTGPGGGIVFYVSATNFTSTGSDCNTACKYLEAAPVAQSTGIAWATTTANCYSLGSDTGNRDCQLNSIYSGNSTAQAASRTAATAIGKGMANTNQIYARLTTAGLVTTSEYAAGIAWAYDNNSKTDWYLPSKDELNQMCKWQRGVAWTSDATVCIGGTLNSGRGASGFSSAYYWSSSEVDADDAWNRSFGSGDQGMGDKNRTDYVRPVRAFG
jgi:hypothetical protein